MLRHPVGLSLWLLPLLVMGADPQHLERLDGSGHCPGCDLRNADLRGFDLRAADLRGADLRGADLRGIALHQLRLGNADLRGANLSHLEVDRDLEFVDLRGVQLEGATFANGVTCGPFPKKGGFGCAAVLNPPDKQ